MTPTATRIALVVGAELRRLRLAAGISQRELALLTGTQRPIVGRIENGFHCPKLAIAALHAEFCGGSAADVGRAIDRATRAPQQRVSARAGR